jgi:hypothetical protein
MKVNFSEETTVDVNTVYSLIILIKGHICTVHLLELTKHEEDLSRREKYSR